ncbi:MAG: siderophore-interacting protein [Pseudomonadota bacterium]
MAKSAPRNLVVASSERLTPNMQRIVLTGDDLIGFPDGQESGYIKLLFPDAPGSTDKKTVMRTYTIRAFDSAENLLTVDFALHDATEGPASAWAKAASPGDRLIIGGPGPTKLVSNEGDWVFLVGDMTALPALACNLEQLPRHAKGHALIEIIDEEDRQQIDAPEGVEVHWFVNPDYHATLGSLADEAQRLPWLGGEAAGWCACEFHSMKALRSYLRDERGIDKTRLYVSSYWKIGRSEDEHKVDKRNDQVTDEKALSLAKV